MSMKYKVVIKHIKRFNKAVDLTNELRALGFRKVTIFEHRGKFGVVVDYFKTKKDAETFVKETKLKHELIIELNN